MRLVVGILRYMAIGLLVLILLYSWSDEADAETVPVIKERESYYVDIDCRAVGGIVEYHNSDGTRTDCQTATVSIEYDFAAKWYECVMQALHYARLNQSFAECRLIIIKANDILLMDKAMDTVLFYRLPVIITKVDGGTP